MDYLDNLIDPNMTNHSTGPQKEDSENKLNYAKIFDDDVKLNKSTCNTKQMIVDKYRIRIFYCKLCTKKFRKVALLEAHLRVHQGQKPYACSQCEKQFVRFNNLRIHIEQTHLGINKSHICTYEGCNSVYTRKDALQRHIKDYHSHLMPIKKYICEVCGKIFQRKIFLDRHLLIHVDKSQLPFECDECGKKFGKKLNLRDHLKRHGDIKDFICIDCGMRKTTKTELKSHMNYHTLEKTWKCVICEKVFNALANLKMHKRIVHEGSRKYVCCYCSKRFGRADTRKNHEMRHTGERPYHCVECGRGFIQAGALHLHMKVH